MGSDAIALNFVKKLAILKEFSGLSFFRDFNKN